MKTIYMKKQKVISGGFILHVINFKFYFFFILNACKQSIKIIIWTQLLLFSVSMLFSSAAFSQKFLGKVINLKTNEVLPYSSIGVRGKAIGGISDINGQFSIDISKAKPDDKIIISYIGYEPKEYLINQLQLNQFYEIPLNPKPQELEEVVVYNKREKVILGNRKKSSNHTGWGGYNESGVGKSRGILINPIGYPVKADKFLMYIDDNTFGNVKFRLNILVPNNKGELPTSLINENIFFTTSEQKKWITVDLKDYNIVISQKVILAVEWVDATEKIKTQEEGNNLLTLSMSKYDGYFYKREKPEDAFYLEFNKRTPSMYLICYGVSDD